MTPADVRARVDALRAQKRDGEADHGEEDEIYLAVLIAIANGVQPARELAAEALRTREFIEVRWYS